MKGINNNDGNAFFLNLRNVSYAKTGNITQQFRRKKKPLNVFFEKKVNVSHC